MPFIATAIGAIATTISGAIAAGGFVGSLVKAALAIALNVGISLLQQALSKQKTPGIKANASVGGKEPLSFIVGAWSTPGHLEYVNSWGPSNNYLVQVFSLADLPLSGLGETMWLNDEEVSLDFDNEHASYGYPVTGKYAGYLWVKYRDGTETTADAYLRDKFGADADRPWTTDMIGTGTPNVIVTTRLNRKLFTGIPKFRFEVSGLKLYDIRKDSTNGGSGTHRWSDQSTWEFTENPAVIIYNILRGITYDSAWVYGGQTIAAERLPSASWIAAANECDVEIDLSDETTEPQFRVGMEIACSAEPLGVIEELLVGCQGRLAEIGGVYKLHVGAPVASVYSFTDDDIVVTEGQSFDPFPSLDQTINAITATYPEPAEAWAEKEAPPLYDTDLEAEDIGRRLVNGVKFECVRYANQVQRLMQAMLLDARRFRTHVITLPPEAWLLEPGVDYVSWTSTRNGYSSKQFLVVGIEGAPGFNQTVSLREVDATDYDWSTSNEREFEFSKIGPFTRDPQVMVGWSVAAANLEGKPSIAVTFDGDEDDIFAVQVQVRLASDSSVVFDGSVPYPGDTASATTILNGVFAPATGYEVRGRFIPLSDRDTDWSSWLAVTTLDLRPGLDDLADEVGAEFDSLSDSITTIIADVSQNASDIADEAAARAAADLSLASDLADEATARAAAVQGVADDLADEAAARVAAVQAVADDLADEATARAAAVQAVADDLADEATARAAAVQAVADDLSDEASARVAAVSAEADARLATALSHATDLQDQRDTLLELATEITELVSNSELERQDIRREIVVERDNLTAAYTEAITVATGPSSAIVVAQTELQAAIDDEVTAREADVSALTAAIATGDAAQATDLTTLKTQIRGSYDGTDYTSVTSGLIYSMRTSFASQFESINTTIESLSAGVDEQFDFATIWNFDSTIQSWTGNGTPTWVSGGGWLRPANHATDPYVVSPSGLDVDTDVYGQVRLRIRKTGSPTWEGYIWWKLDGDTTWDAGRRDSISEPSFDANGLAVINFTPGYTGTLDQLRIDLSSDQDASNYYEIDWVAVGRPSPGASIASVDTINTTLANAIEAEASSRQTLSALLTGESDPDGSETLAGLSSGLLYDERIARTTEDAAIAADVTALDTRLTDAETELSANSSALSTLETTVTTIGSDLDTAEAGIAANSTAITSLNAAVDDKADASALSTLEASVEALADGSIRSQSEAIRALSASLLEVAGEVIEGQAGSDLNRQEIQAAQASIQEVLTARVDSTDDSVTAITGRVETLESSIGDYALLTITDALDARVTENEDGIAANLTAITSLQASVTANESDIAANSSALTALTSTVTTNGTDIDSNSAAITTLQNDLTSAEGDISANSTAITSLDSRVTANEGDISSNSSAITALENDVSTAQGDILANSSAVSALTSRVTANEDDIASISTSITTLQDDIESAVTDIATNSSAITALQSSVSANGDDIDSNSSAITVLQNGLTSAEGDIAANSSAITSLDSRVTANESGISSNSSAITLLETGLTDAEADIAANTSALSALDTRVTSNEDGISANSTAITSLGAAVDDKADASALTSLQAAVEALADGSISSHSEAIRALSASVLEVAGEVIEGQAGSDLERQALAAAQANIQEVLTARVDQTDDSVTAITSRVETLEASISDYALLTITDALDARVTENEDGIAANLTAITSLQASVTAAESNITATSTALTALTSRVTTNESDIDANSAAITSLENDVSDAQGDIIATSSALTTLTSRVTTNEGDIDANSTAITNLDNSLTSAVADITANSSAITALDSRVTDNEGDISSNAAAITALQTDLTTAEGDISANSTALTTLTSRVTTNEGDIDANSTAITNLNNSLTSAVADITANSSAITALDSRVTDNEDGISSNSAAITALQTDLTAAEGDISANSSALTALTSRVTTNEGDIDANSSAITSLGNDLTAAEGDISANSSAITSLDSRVTANEGDISSISTAVTALETGLSSAEDDIAANSGAITALDTRVTDNEDGIAANSTAITALDSRVTDNEGNIASNAGVISGLYTSVTEQGDTLTALAGQVTALSATVDDNSAGGLVKFEAQATPTGVDARYAIVLAASLGGAEKNAGLLMDLYTEASTLKSRIALKADEIFMLDDSTGTLKAPFVYTGGSLYLDDVLIQTANIGDGTITSAKTGPLYIQ